MLYNLWIAMLLSGFIVLFIALLLFFLWRVPDLLEELSGKKAKKQIKLMKDIHSNSESLGRFSTSEVYMTIPSGSLLSEELGSIKDRIALQESKSVIQEDNIDVDDVVTSELDSCDSTGLLSLDDSKTSFLEESVIESNNTYVITVLEEQSSL